MIAFDTLIESKVIKACQLNESDLKPYLTLKLPKYITQAHILQLLQFLNLQPLQQASSDFIHQ